MEQKARPPPGYTTEMVFHVSRRHEKEEAMQFYIKQHKHYCGIDLHASSMYLCIIDSKGNVLLHKKIKTDPKAFLKAIAPYRDDLVVGVECVFMWYWIADLCSDTDMFLGRRAR